MAMLRAKQIKLNAASDLLIGGSNGSGAILAADGAVGTVLQTTAEGVIGYAALSSEFVTYDNTVSGLESETVEAAIGELNAKIENINDLGALNFAGELAGSIEAAALPANPARGDMYRIITAGSTNFGGTGIEVNVGDFVAFAGTQLIEEVETKVWVKFDNTDPGVTVANGETALSVTGTPHTGFELALDQSAIDINETSGVLEVAKGGTGLDAAGAEGTYLRVGEEGLEYGFISGLTDAAGVTVAAVNGDGELAAIAAITDESDDLAYSTKGYVDALVADSVSAAAPELVEDEHVAVAAAANLEKTLSQTPIGKVAVYFNGIKLKAADFTVAAGVVTLVDSSIGYTVEIGDVVTYSYMAVVAPAGE